MFGFPVLLGVGYFLFFLSTTGFRWGPLGSAVGVVRIEGAIGANERASAQAILPLLEKAFANPSVKAVVLSIDCPDLINSYTPIGGIHLSNERDEIDTKRL